MSRSRRLALAAAALTVAAPACGGEPSRPAPIGAGSPAAAARLVAEVEGMSEYRLGNGLRVVLFPEASAPTVTVDVIYLVGSRHEGYGESGMAHLLEHMLFKGTPRHPKVWWELDEHGAQFNGYTMHDRTSYYETMAARDDNLRWALDLEADRMVNARVSKDDLASEFSVVLNEFEIDENQPRTVLEERMMSTAFLWHNYGKSPIGSRADVERVPVEALRAFYRRYYRPDNAVLVVAGKFAPDAALRMIGDTFGALPVPPGPPPPPTYTVEPVQDGERQVALRRTGDVGMVGLTYHGLAAGDADFAAEQALMDALVHEPTGRLYRALVEPGLATRPRAEAYLLTEPGAMVITADVAPGVAVDRVRKVMTETVEALGDAELTAAELDRFKASALRAIEVSLDDPARVGVDLADWVPLGDWRLMFLHRDAIHGLTAERVRRVARAFLKESNRTVGVFLPTPAPDRAPLPAPLDAPALVRGYRGAEQIQPGEPFAATAANIERRTVRSQLPVGMKLALLAKRTRGQTVKLALRINAGVDEAADPGAATAAAMLPELVLRGTTRHGYARLRDELDRLHARIRPVPKLAFRARPGEAMFAIDTVRGHLPEVVALLAEIVREPLLAEAEFDQLRAEQLSRLESDRQQPEAIARRTLLGSAAPWPSTDPRHQPTIAEAIERTRAVRIAALRSFHRQAWGAASAELVAVGDFDPAALEAVVAERFGGWTAPRAFHRLAVPYRAPQPVDALIVTPDKQMAMVGIAAPLELRDDDPEFAALRLANFIYGGSFKSRLFERLRQKEGVSYGTESSLDADPFDRNGMLLAYAFCAPKNAGAAMAAIVEELAALRDRGVRADELRLAQLAMLERWNTALATDDEVVQLLATTLHTGRSVLFYEDLQRRIQGLTPADVGAALAKHVQPGLFVRARVGDIHD